MENLNSLSGSQLASLYLEMAKIAAELEQKLRQAEQQRYLIYVAGVENCGQDDWLEEIEKATPDPFIVYHIEDYYNYKTFN